MSPTAVRALRRGILATLGAGVALLFTSAAHRVVLDVYVLVLAAIALLALVRTVRALAPRRVPSAFEQALGRLRTPVAEVAAALPEERDVILSRINGFHYHARVRPVLREVAGQRLRTRYGVDLDAEPERARELVPGHAWEVVRPDRPPPRDGLMRGPSLEEQRIVLEELEAL